MVVEDLGAEAKEAAVREVSKLLPLPELFPTVVSIKSDYVARQQVNDAQLSTMVVEQVEQAQRGLQSLSFSQTTVNRLRDSFVEFEKLCQECQTLIENHDRVKLLRNARNNLNTTLKDVLGMMSISVVAAEARDLLSDDRELINTYECTTLELTVLDGKRRFALAAASSHGEEVVRLSLFTTYKCAENAWMVKLYKLRHKWCSAFNKDHFSGGVLSSQRSETTNKSLSVRLSETSGFCDFYKIDLFCAQK